MISTDDGSDGRRYRVTFDDDGELSTWLAAGEIISSGGDRTAHLSKAMEELTDELASECAHLSETMRDALHQVRARVAKDELPLLSLLQAEPLQMQSSHLSFQEYFTARAICEANV